MKNAIEIGRYIIVPEPKRFDAFARKPCAALLISGCGLWEAMLSSVQFNRKMSGRSIKIENIAANGMLPAKIRVANLISAKRLPKDLLNVSGVATQPARISCDGSRARKA